MSTKASHSHSLARLCRFPLLLGIAAFMVILEGTAHGQFYGTVVLDPGHGGRDGGANHGRATEKRVNLLLAVTVERHLHDLGINTAITPDRDVWMSLADRADYSKHFQQPLFVSLHYNAAPRASADGIETFYYNQTSRRLARLIQRALIRATGARDRGVKHNKTFRVIRKNVAPVAVLVEGGFLSNVRERQRVVQPGYREMQAHAIASAIATFMGRHPMATQPRNIAKIRQPRQPRFPMLKWASAKTQQPNRSLFQRMVSFRR